MLSIVFVLLAQLASPADPATNGSPNAPDLTTRIVRLDNDREAVFKLRADGRPVEALVRRLDGKRMTCDRYMAWFAQWYTCTGNCTYDYLVSGSGSSNINRYAACEAARADACADATCSSGTYMFCSLVESFSMSLTQGTECSYSQYHACAVADDCSVE